MNWLLTHTHQIGFSSTGKVERPTTPERFADSAVVPAAAVDQDVHRPSAALVGASDSAVGVLHSCTFLLHHPYCVGSGAPERINSALVSLSFKSL